MWPKALYMLSRYMQGMIVQVRAYVDSVLVTKVITEAETQDT